MNKPFTLEGYKKNPSRLRWSEDMDTPPKWSAIVDGKLCVIWKDEKRSIYDLATFFNTSPSHYTLVLATEYEVRHARPYRTKEGGLGLETHPDGLDRTPDACSTWSWAGPEFEYKVEKP